MGSEDGGGLKVLMFPWLAHGHITPFLELAKRLSDRHFHCYICSTQVNLNPIKQRIAQKHEHNIEPVELRVRSSPELPAHHHSTNGLPLHLHTTLKQALKTSKPEFVNLLRTLKPNLLIHDIVIPWAGSLALRLNIVSVMFHTSRATMMSYFCHLGKYPRKEFPFPAICLNKFQRSMAFSYLKDAGEERKDEADPDDDEANYKTKGGMIMLVNSTRAMEGKYMVLEVWIVWIRQDQSKSSPDRIR